MDPIFDPIKMEIDFSSHVPSNNGVLVVNTVRDVYSAWKRWAIKDGNLKYGEICQALGGFPLPDGSKVEIAVIIKSGWKLLPPNFNHKFVIDGKLYESDGNFPIADVGDAVEIVVIGLDKKDISGDDSKLNAAFKLEPNLFGIGIDLKKAWKLLKTKAAG